MNAQAAFAFEHERAPTHAGRAPARSINRKETSMKHVLLARGGPLLAAAAFAIAGVAGAQTYSTPAKEGTAAPPTTPMTSPTTPMAAPSAAQNVPARTEPADAAFRTLDANNRGYLAKSDVAAISGFSFEQADTNKDGKLTKDEFAKAWSASK
jgi:hypothetical protein